MSVDPTLSNSPDVASQTPIDPPTGGGESVAELKREVERLRAQLAKATAETETYRRAAYAMLEQLDPYIPPTEEELHDMIHGPRDRSIRDIIAELEREGDK
jgi:hypothetical protein